MFMLWSGREWVGEWVRRRPLGKKGQLWRGRKGWERLQREWQRAGLKGEARAVKSVEERDKGEKKVTGEIFWGEEKLVRRFQRRKANPGTVKRKAGGRERTNRKRTGQEYVGFSAGKITVGPLRGKAVEGKGPTENGQGKSTFACYAWLIKGFPGGKYVYYSEKFK